MWFLGRYTAGVWQIRALWN